jgi:predicted enzyme related to lactoylglutathione lyase
MARPVHFEIPVENPQRAIDFYSKMFGWTFAKFGGPMDYWLVTTGEAPDIGINGGLLMRTEPSQKCCNTIGVEDLDATLAALVVNGGTVLTPKMAIPGIGWLAYGADPEGNVFGMMEPDTNAR